MFMHVEYGLLLFNGGRCIWFLFYCETQTCYEQMHQFGRLFLMVFSSAAHPVPLPLEWIGKQLKRMPVRHDQSTCLRSAMDAFMHASRGTISGPLPL